MPLKGQKKLKKSARTRQFIIEKSAPVFNGKGYAGTSMHDITESTGLTKGSIYGNFKDKEALAIAAFEYNSRCILDQIKPLVLSDRNTRDKLTAITGFYRNYLYEPQLREGCPLLNTAVEADDTHPVLRDLSLRSLDYLRRSFIFIMDQGKINGEIQQHIDTEHYATVFLALIEGGIMQTKLYNKSRFLIDCLNRIDQMVEEIMIR